GRVNDCQRDPKKKFGQLPLTAETRAAIDEEMAAIKSSLRLRRTEVLRLVGINLSSWYRRSQDQEQRKRPGPGARAISEEMVQAVVKMATDNPWYGYKCIAVMCRRAGCAVKNREAYLVMRDHRLLQRPKVRAAEVYQAARLFELLPHKPNDLWHID